jgi:hypothetical protein
VTGDLVAFLRVRLDEDEAKAQAADKTAGGKWWPTDSGIVADGLGLPDALHMAHWSPARVLREVEAKRAILAIHAPSEAMGPDSCAVCITDREGYPEEWCSDDYPCQTLRVLVAVYRDHPDYDQGWAP